MAQPYTYVVSEDDSDDEENVPFGIGNGVTKLDKEEKEVQAWDIFENNPPEDETLAYEDQKLYIYTIKAIKVITYIMVFIIVLGTGVVSKMMVLIMTSQIKPQTSRQLCHDIPRRKREVEISYLERIQWTWALFFCFIIPELGAIVRSFRIWLFKNPLKPTIVEFTIPLVFELLHVIGLGLLTFTVLPSVHVIKGTMMASAVFFVPGLLLLLSRAPSKDPNEAKSNKWIISMVVDSIALLCQLYGLVFWPYLMSKDDKYSMDKPWLFPLAAVLTSFGWWENFVSKNSAIGFIRRLGIMRKRFELTRHYSYLFIPFLKIGVFLATMFLSIWLVGEDQPSMYFDYFQTSYETTNLTVTEVGQPISEGVTVSNSVPNLGDPSLILQKIIFLENSDTAVLYTILTQFLAAWVCYITAKFACKIRIQGFSFALPLTLSIPVTLAVLVSICGMRNDDVCVAKSILPDYLYWTCPTGSFGSEFITEEYGWIWILFYLSQIWTVLHIWYPSATRLASTEVLFCFPMYSALLSDSDLVLNRKNDFDRKNNLHQRKGSVSADSEDSDDVINFGGGNRGFGQQNEFGYVPTQEEEDKVPKIVACATMWHEEEAEMICMFKSVFRLDADQNARRVARTVFGVNDPSYYEYETQIFFDDAFKAKSKTNPVPVINDYVRLMLPAIDKAASLVHEVNMTIGKPKRIPTPYGGRLEWILPGKTKLTIHLKNKEKIRHRKRWSQVMYMYYLLGFKITANPEYTVERQEVIARNTFILALDGDVDFQPNAVELLVDLMKKNPNLGAACGRIHPTGGGPMVWYQKFEYAIGHWLQKATEHMIGCVLCSPGCFSLFRAKGLMDANVMAKYTTPPSEPRHYVQYDQGEDRWLCTLLLQQGWRVEYCAASDALTHAPEGFNEFYNQRRRWVPSTMANILDLLVDYKRTVKINPNISFPYILYQSVLMGGSVLGPGTIFLMLVGAFVAAFKIDNYKSMYFNISPILLFMLCCYFCKAKTQLKLAQLLSVIYGLIMVAVLIALALQLVQDGLLAPSSIFLVAITISFVVSAIVHPLEFDCLIHGVLYYITIPSMYLLLIIYSLFNLNDVTWGTRENPAVVAEQKAAEAALAAAGGAPKAGGGGAAKKSFLAGLVPDKWLGAGEDEEGSFEFNCAGLFKLACCTHEKPKDELTQVIVKLDAKLGKIESQIAASTAALNATTSTIALQQSIKSTGSGQGGSGNGTNGSKENTMSTLKTITEGVPTGANGNQNDLLSTKVIKIDDLMNPPWIEDKDLRRGEVDFLTGAEIDFWNNMIAAYLLPLFEDKEEKEKIKNGLLDLRNKVVAAFFLFNAVFVTAMFLLQLNKDQIYLNWPLGGIHNMTWDEDTATITVNTEYLQLEPLGLLFVGFYAIILVVQFTAMLFHRFGTYAHIMASTMLGWFDGGSDHDTKLEIKSIKVIQQMQKIKTANEDHDEGDTGGGGIGRRKTIIDLHKSKTKKVQIRTLDRAFEKRMTMFQNAPDREGMLRRATKVGFGGGNFNALNSLMTRRDTIMANTERRNTAFQPETNFGNKRGGGIIRRDTFGRPPMPAPDYDISPPPPPPPPQPFVPRNFRGQPPTSFQFQ